MIFYRFLVILNIILELIRASLRAQRGAHVELFWDLAKWTSRAPNRGLSCSSIAAELQLSCEGVGVNVGMIWDEIILVCLATMRDALLEPNPTPPGANVTQACASLQ